jgi:hypothetical protein
MTGLPLTGRTFDLDLGPFVRRVTFLSDTQMRLRAQIGPNTIDEVVKIDVTTVRPNVFMIGWTEQSGNFIVQLQDHENSVVHNQARLADGQVFQAKGAIRAVAA